MTALWTFAECQLSLAACCDQSNQRELTQDTFLRRAARSGSARRVSAPASMLSGLSCGLLSRHCASRALLLQHEEEQGAQGVLVLSSQAHSAAGDYPWSLSVQALQMHPPYVQLTFVGQQHAGGLSACDVRLPLPHVHLRDTLATHLATGKLPLSPEPLPILQCNLPM